MATAKDFIMKSADPWRSWLVVYEDELYGTRRYAAFRVRNKDEALAAFTQQYQHFARIIAIEPMSVAESVKDFFMQAAKGIPRNWLVAWRDSSGKTFQTIVYDLNAEDATNYVLQAWPGSTVYKVVPYHQESAKDFVMKAQPPDPQWTPPDVMRDEQGRAFRWRYDTKGMVMHLNYEGGGQYSVELRRWGVDDYLRSIKGDNGSYVWPATTVTAAEYKAKELVKKVLMGRRLESRSPKEFFRKLGKAQRYRIVPRSTYGGPFQGENNFLVYADDAAPATTRTFVGIIRKSWDGHMDRWSPFKVAVPVPGKRTKFRSTNSLQSYGSKEEAAAELHRDYNGQVRSPRFEGKSPKEFLKSIAIYEPWFQRFYHSYIEAALWSSTDDEGNPLDSVIANLSDDAREKMEADCRRFYVQNRADIENGDVDRAGHDFWLTRNGHGVDFSDRWPDEVAERLNQAAKAFGSFDLYVDDGQIYGN